MNPRAPRVLGFPSVLERLAALCVSPIGREQVVALEPSPWLDEAERRQRLTTEARRLADAAGGLPVRGIRDVRPPVHHASIGGVLAALQVNSGKIQSARVGVTGASSHATRLTEVEEALVGKAASTSTIEAAARLAGANLADVNSDIHASEEYRRAMIPVFTQRALARALARTA